MTACGAKHVLAIILLSVCLSRPVTKPSPAEIETPVFHSSFACFFVTKFCTTGWGDSLWMKTSNRGTFSKMHNFCYCGCTVGDPTPPGWPLWRTTYHCTTSPLRMLSKWPWISRCGDYWQQAELCTDGACRIMMMMMFWLQVAPSCWWCLKLCMRSCRRCSELEIHCTDDTRCRTTLEWTSNCM